MAKTNASNAPTKTATATTTVKRGRKGLRCRNLSNEQRESLLQSLLKHRTSAVSKGKKSSSDEVNNNNNENSGASQKLRKGALLEASRAFGVSTKTCKRIWERFLETSDESGSGGDVSHRKHQSGRPKKISAEDLLSKIMELPPETRSSVRGLARALGMPHTTIHRRLKSGEIKLESLLSNKGKGDDAEKENGKSSKTQTSHLETDKNMVAGSKIPKSKATAKNNGEATVRAKP